MLEIDKLDGNLAVFSGLSYKYISLPFSLQPPKYNSRMEAEWIFPFPVKWDSALPLPSWSKTDKSDTKFSPIRTEDLHHRGLFCERPTSFRTLLIWLQSERNSNYYCE